MLCGLINFPLIALSHNVAQNYLNHYFPSFALFLIVIKDFLLFLTQFFLGDLQKFFRFQSQLEVEGSNSNFKPKITLILLCNISW